MGRVVLAAFLTLVIMHVGAFLSYGTFSALTGLEAPEGAAPAVFFLSVLVQKVGHALAFVLILRLARETLSRHWLAYAALWWLTFALSEAGQAIGPGYSWQEATAGMIAEAMYFPASAFVTKWLIGVKTAAARTP